MKKAFKYRQCLRAKCPFLYDIANPPVIQSRSLYHPLTIPPTPSPSSTNPSIAAPALASHSSIVSRFLTFRCVRAIQEVYFRPDLERYMTEHHSGIWEKVPRFTCHLPAYRCCSACEASHLSLVQVRGMIGQGTEVREEDQKIKGIITASAAG